MGLNGALIGLNWIHNGTSISLNGIDRLNIVEQFFLVVWFNQEQLNEWK